MPGHQELANRAPEEAPAVSTEEAPDEVATEAEAERLEPVARVEEEAPERAPEEVLTDEPAAVAAESNEEDRPSPTA